MGPAPPEPLLAAVVVARLTAEAAANPEREVCGLVVELSGAQEVWPVRNASPDPSRRFELDPGALIEALRRLRAPGGRLVAIYHSHPSGGGGLSALDLDLTLLDGAPAWPEALQVVVARTDRAWSVHVHRWDGARFLEACCFRG